MNEIIALIKKRLEAIRDFDEKVRFLNKLRKEISKLSPFIDPIDYVNGLRQKMFKQMNIILM